MAAHRIHVVPHVLREGGEPEGQFATKREAERAAKDYARPHGAWEPVIHDRHVRIRDSDTMGRAHEGHGHDRVR